METKYISLSRGKLLDSAANRHLLGLEVVQTNSLENFSQSHGQRLSHAKYLIVDLDGLVDNSDEIVKSLNLLRNLHDDLRIIVLADKTEMREMRDDLTELLRRIWRDGIYNIITDFSDEELDYCILKGKSEEEGKAAFTPKAEPPVFTDSSKRAVASLFHSAEQQDKETLQTSAQAAVTRHRNQFDTAPSKQPRPKEIIRANKEFRKFKEYISVGVCGTQAHIGATHAALQITRFLKDINFKACYVEAAQDGNIEAIKDYYNQTNYNPRKNMLQYSGVNIFYKGFEMVKIMAEKYDFYVFDLGVLSKDTINQFLMRTVQIVVSGTKPWELAHLENAVQLLGGGKNINYLLNFANKTKDAAILNRFMLKEAFFADYETNPFKSGANLEAYKRIFKEYIVHEEIPRPHDIKRKRGLFG